MRILVQLLGGSLLMLMALTAYAAPSPLQIDDCLKCHDEIVNTVTNRGAKHSTETTCFDCHTEHPPECAEAIPACNQCHAPEDKPHYKVPDCLSCHNPHDPLNIDLSKVDLVKPTCISCHANEGNQLSRYPSMHSELDCNECHLEHGEFLGCMECHEPHNDTMVYADCVTCHKPHMPMLVKYPESIPSSHCASCHEAEPKLLAATKTLHKDLSCAFCHKSQHKVIPKCTTCHGVPHAAVLHNKFPDCLKCHIDAHDLHK